jgi:hypothetical protein
MFVGGEFYYEDKWLSSAPTITTDGMYFLAGGQACLMVIGGYLRAQGIERVLLPSYLCPSILTALGHCGLAFDFYRVNEDLSIDLDDLARKAAAHRALYFINYFGFLPAAEALGFFQTMQQHGKLVIEDNAQAGFASHPSGDFVFNSLRKLAPYDGGYLLTRHDMQPHIEPYRGRPNRRLPVMRAYRRRLPAYLFHDEDDYDELERLFRLSEEYYAEDFCVMGDPEERANIERLDWEGIRRTRRENYNYLLELIAPIQEIEPIFPALQDDNQPLGLPVYVNDVSRDAVYEQLGNAEIGLPIHWEEIRHHPATCGDQLAVQMAGKMLTLVIDQRTSREQLDYLAAQLKRAVKVVRNQ